MAACALLDKNGNPTDEEIRASVDSVYCRCTGYVRIAEAYQGSGSHREGVQMNQPDSRFGGAASFLVVGRDVPRTDAVPKVTGAAQYVADISMPGMLHAAVLRSPHPHARILAIDVSAAAAMPGVKAVLAGEDTPRRKWGAFRPDLYPLAIGKVRYVGDEVAAVAATDAAIARAAVDRIVVRIRSAAGRAFAR